MSAWPSTTKSACCKPVLPKGTGKRAAFATHPAARRAQLIFGADGGTRTLTRSPSQDFKSCVSTGSTTSAPTDLMAGHRRKRNNGAPIAWHGWAVAPVPSASAKQLQPRIFFRYRDQQLAAMPPPGPCRTHSAPFSSAPTVHRVCRPRSYGDIADRIRPACPKRFPRNR